MGAPSATSPAAPVTAGKPGLRNHHGNDQLMRTAIVATLAAAVGFYFGHRHGQAMHPAEAAAARRLEELRTASSSVLQPYVPKPVYTGSDGDDWTHSMSTRVCARVHQLLPGAYDAAAHKGRVGGSGR